ncbi:MAG TPA: hypothetical protein VK463_02460 [Desulfomonilaceae bacterium]|nr:hypothetical protein [Desulfomonilaceae bacterium]
MAIKETFDYVVRSVKETMGMETEEHDETEVSRNLDSISGEFKREFTNDIEVQLSDRIEERSVRPHVEVWPFDDEDAQWYASHSDKSRAVICNTPEFRDLPFCGSGFH